MQIGIWRVFSFLLKTSTNSSRQVKRAQITFKYTFSFSFRHQKYIEQNKVVISSLVKTAIIFVYSSIYKKETLFSTDSKNSTIVFKNVKIKCIFHKISYHISYHIIGFMFVNIYSYLYWLIIILESWKQRNKLHFWKCFDFENFIFFYCSLSDSFNSGKCSSVRDKST